MEVSGLRAYFVFPEDDDHGIQQRVLRVAHDFVAPERTALLRIPGHPTKVCSWIHEIYSHDQMILFLFSKASHSDDWLRSAEDMLRSVVELAVPTWEKFPVVLVDRAFRVFSLLDHRQNISAWGLRGMVDAVARVASARPVAGRRGTSPTVTSPTINGNVTSGTLGGGGGRDADRVECYFVAAMPEVPAAGVRARVEVTISRERIARRAEALENHASRRIPKVGDLMVEVLPRHNVKTMGAARAVVPVPEPGMPEELVFEIEGVAPGPAEVWVEVRLGPRKLSTMVLQPHFGAKAAVRTWAVGHPARPEPAAVEMTIIEEKVEGSVRLRFIVKSRDLHVRLDCQSKQLRIEKATYIADIYGKIATEYGTSGTDFARYLRQIENLGGGLVTELAPMDVRRAFWQFRNRIGSIEVISDDPTIPWEVGFLTDPETDLVSSDSRFLGELGLVRWFQNQGFPPAFLRARRGQARYVVPDYPDRSGLSLPNAKREAEMLKELFDAAEIEPTSDRVLQDLREGEVADLYHFCCHGEAETKGIWKSRLRMRGRMSPEGYVGDDISVDDVRNRTQIGRDGRRPIVFLNACNTGRIGNTLTSTGGMAEAFVKSGAGLFVGALWAVGDRVAQHFSCAFYEALLEGCSVTEAAGAARIAARDAKEPTWLAFTVYGHPHGRLVEADRRTMRRCGGS
jgi:hypothetical protein